MFIKSLFNTILCSEESYSSQYSQGKTEVLKIKSLMQLLSGWGLMHYFLHWIILLFSSPVLSLSCWTATSPLYNYRSFLLLGSRQVPIVVQPLVILQSSWTLRYKCKGNSEEYKAYNWGIAYSSLTLSPTMLRKAILQLPRRIHQIKYTSKLTLKAPSTDNGEKRAHLGNDSPQFQGLNEIA